MPKILTHPDLRNIDAWKRLELARRELNLAYEWVIGEHDPTKRDLKRLKDEAVKLQIRAATIVEMVERAEGEIEEVEEWWE